jgi:peptide/nickel transport system permease protein
MRETWRRAWQVLRGNHLALAGGLLMVGFVLMGLLAPALAPYDPNSVNLDERLQRPTPRHWLGTDHQGRDILSRILFGARLSLYLGVGSVALGGSLGVVAGLLAGYFRSLFSPIMRIMDILLAFPGIVIALTTVAILGSGTFNVVLAVGLSQLPQFGRVIYGMVLTLREETFVTAARSLGATDGTIVRRHILPNVLGPIIVQTSLLLPVAILTGASLSFLGAGVQPPTPEWGAMLNDSRQWMVVAPHLMVAPGVALILVVLGFNIFGDGLRDALDPRSRTTSPGGSP